MEFVEKVSLKDYDKFVKEHKTSHFLKSTEWAEVSKLRGFNTYFVGVRKNKKLVATALLLQKHLPLGYSYFYIPRGYTIDYTDKELISFFTFEIAKFTKSKKSLFFKIDPDIKLHTIDKDAKVIEGAENNYELVNCLKKIGFKHKKLNLFFEGMQPRFTFRVNISDDMDVIRKRYSKSVIRWIKKANKYGVTAEIGKKSDVSEFVRLMKLTEKRQGFYSHEYDFYPKLYDIFSKSDSISLMMAKVDIDKVCGVLDEEIASSDGEKHDKLIVRKEMYQDLKNESNIKVVSSYINIHYGNKSWYLYGANDMDFKDTFANYKLFDFQIEKSHDLGLEIFDEFGTVGDPNTTKSVAGLHEFKKKFGGEYTEFIGEFDYVTNKFMYFVFTKLIPLYRKPLLMIRHFKVKNQKGDK